MSRYYKVLGEVERTLRHMEPITGRNDIRHLDRRVVAGWMKKLSAKERKDEEEVYAKSVQGTHAGGEFAGTCRSSCLGRGDDPARCWLPGQRYLPQGAYKASR